MPKMIERLTPYLDEIEKIIQESDNSPILMAKIYIENTLLSDSDKKRLEEYAYDYLKENYLKVT